MESPDVRLVFDFDPDLYEKAKRERELIRITTIHDINEALGIDNPDHSALESAHDHLHD